MNERLNELRLDAGISRLHDEPYLVAINQAGEIVEPLVGLEKFAELIVKECSQYIEDKFDFCGDELIIAEKLLEHFGVE